MFKLLLTTKGPVASEAAQSILSIASKLPPATQAQLPGEFEKAVVDGAGDAVGKQTVDGLAGLLKRTFADSDHGQGSATSQSITVKVLPPKPVTLEVLQPRPISVTVRPTQPVTVTVALEHTKEPPTSFVWFYRTWGRDDRLSFEDEFGKKHSKEVQVVEQQRLTELYRCHPTMRKVLGVASMKGAAHRPCDRHT